MSAIRHAAESFITDLDALRGMVDPLMFVTEKLGDKFDEDHLKALEEHGTEIDPDGATRKFNIPPEHLQKIKKLRNQNEQFRVATKLLPRTFLVSFISTYDAYLGNLTQALFELKPEVLNASGKQLTFKELVGLENIEAARRHVVDCEVEALLRKSHAEQFEWLEKAFDVKLRSGLARWPLFIEVTERRNLFVHCHGKVSGQYLKNCAEHKADTNGVAVGAILGANKKYLIEAYKCLYEIGVKLSQVLWRKLNPDDLTSADEALVSITFELLVLEKFDLANRLLEFATGLPRFSSESTKRIYLVNYAQTFKFTERQDECLATLAKMDWSACSDNFAVCVAVLKDHFKEAATIMRRIGKGGQIKRHEYIDWPVFREFRKSKEFSEVYCEVFGVAPSEVQKHASQESTMRIADGDSGPEAPEVAGESETE